MVPDRPDFSSVFLEGVDRFNERRYWNAHESWERLWLCASPPLKQFLQGLIQLAAAYHHVQRGNVAGAVRLFDSALSKLAPYPPGHCGINRESVTREAEADRLASASGAVDSVRFPRIPVPDASAFPSRAEW